MKKLPMQPLVLTETGVMRFTANRIVEDLYDFGVERGFGMNEIVMDAIRGKYTKEELMQFSQLLGYSVSGYADLSYASEESIDEAWEAMEEMLKDEEEEV